MDAETIKQLGGGSAQLILAAVCCALTYGVWKLAEALHWSGFGRLVQIIGGALFVRASLRHACGEWGWLLVFAVAAIFAAII